MVVGAGASYDSVHPSGITGAELEGPEPGDRRYQWSEVRPPLTQDLVGYGTVVRELTVRYPRVRPLVSALRRELGVGTNLPNKSLEEALRDYSALAGSDVPQHLAAFRFYLRDYLWLVSDYTLASRPPSAGWTPGTTAPVGSWLTATSPADRSHGQPPVHWPGGSCSS